MAAADPAGERKRRVEVVRLESVLISDAGHT
jgi:hypothetical protein